MSGRFSHQNTTTYQAPLFGSFLGGPEAVGLKQPESQRRTAPDSTTTMSSRQPCLPKRASASPICVIPRSRQTMERTTRRHLVSPATAPTEQTIHATSSGQVAFAANVFSSPLIGYSASLPWLRAESNIDFANNWTKILGNHTLKAGADIRRVRDDLLQGNNNAAAGAVLFPGKHDFRARCDHIQRQRHRGGQRHGQHSVRRSL